MTAFARWAWNQFLADTYDYVPIQARLPLGALRTNLTGQVRLTLHVYAPLNRSVFLRDLVHFLSTETRRKPEKFVVITTSQTPEG